jgi:hypothetical protein
MRKKRSKRGKGVWKKIKDRVRKKMKKKQFPMNTKGSGKGPSKKRQRTANGSRMKAKPDSTSIKKARARGNVAPSNMVPGE